MIMKKTIAVILALLMILTIPMMMPNAKADPTPPTVTTNDATGVKNTNATFNGYLDADGGEGCTVGFEYGLTTGYGNSVVPYPSNSATYVYAGGLTTNKVYQYWASNLTKKAETADYGGRVIGIAEDLEYIYVVGYTTKKINQYWKSNLTLKAQSGVYGSGEIEAGVVVDDTYVYTGGGIPQTVNQYWKSNLTLKANTEDIGGSMYALAIDDLYVYAGGAPGYVKRYWKSNMTQKDSGYYGNGINEIIVDELYVYAGGYSPSKIFQYWKSNLSKKAESASLPNVIESLVSNEGYIYAGTQGNSRVTKYYKSTLAKAGESIQYGSDIRGLTVDGNYIYAGGETTKKVWKLYKSNLSKITESADYGGTLIAFSSSSPYVTGNAFSYNMDGLAPFTLYHYRAVATNTNSTVYGSDKTFRTLPNAPTGLTVANTGIKEQNISWNHGTGYNQSVVRATIGSYPANPQSGTAIYNGTNNYVVRGGLTPGQDWYYRTWEYSVWGNQSMFSDTYAQGHSLVTAVVTGNATNITGTSVTLSGNLIENDGVNYTVKFEYGLTTTYGNYAVPYTNYLVPYLYAGGWTSNNLWQWRTSNGTKVTEAPSYGNVVDAVADDSTYVYYGGRVIYTVCKAWKSNMTKICESSSYGGDINSIVVDDNYVYVGGNNWPTERVNLYWKSNLTYKGQTSTSYGSAIYCVTVDDTYIYVGGGANTVKRYLKSDLTETTGIASVGQSIYRIVVDNKYIFTGDNDGMVRQYWKSNLTYITQVNFGAYTRIYGMSDDNDNLYVCGYVTTGMLYKYRKSDMTKLAQTAYVSGNWMGIVVDSTYVYAMVNDWVGNGIIRQYWKSNLTQKTTFTPYSGSPMNLVGKGLLQAGNTFSSNLADLMPNTLYHYRAVSNNANGTSYGLDKTFSTPIIAPTVVTNDATGIGATNVTLNGQLTNDGGEGCNVRIEYGLTTAYGNTLVPYSSYLSDYIYAGGNVNYKVYQYWASNLTKKAETISCGQEIYAITEDRTYVYAGTINGDVYQFWKSNLTEKASASYGQSIYCLAEDENYLYVGGGQSKIYQYWKSNMTYKAQTISCNWIHCVILDDNYLYVGGESNTIRQFWISNLTYKAQSADYGGRIRDLAQDDIYLYGGGFNTHKVYQWWKSNLTKKAEAPDYGSNIDSVATDELYVYAGGSVPYKIRQYYKSDMSLKAQTVALDVLMSIFVDTSYVYSMGYSTKLFRFTKDMSKVGESASYGGTIDAITSVYYYRTGNMFSYNLKELTPGKIYHYRAVVTNTNSTVYGSDKEFMTKPALPNMTATVQGFSINLSWIKGTGANNTYIEYKKDIYTTWTRGTGTLLYNGTGTYYLHQNLPKATYYYQIWSYAKYNSSYIQWSDTYVSVIKARPDAPTWRSYGIFVHDVGTSITLRRAYQYWTENMTKKGTSSNLGAGYIYAIVADDNYLYISAGSDNIKKIRISDMALDLQSPSPGYSLVYAMAIDDTYVYRAGGTPQTIYQHYKTDLVKRAESPSYGGDVFALAVDDTYVYAGGKTTQTVRKYQKSDMSYVAETANYGGQINAIIVDDLYIYAGGVLTNKVYKYLKSNMSKVAESTPYGGYIQALAQDDTYLYVAGTTTFKVYQYWKSNLTKKAESTSYSGQINALAVDDTYIYAGGELPCKIYQYWKTNMTKKAESEAFPGNIFALALTTPIDITVLSPSDKSILSGQLYANLTARVSNFESPVNVTFYNASNNAILVKYTAVGNGTKYFNWQNLSVGLIYQWYVVVNGTFENLKSSTWSFTPFSIPATNNFRIETITDNNITIKWDNPPQQAWIAFSISSKLSEVRQILGSSQEWFVSNLLKNTLYNLQWQVGDNYSAMSEYNDFNFSTDSWKSGLNNFAYKKLVTINHTGVVSDKDNYALNLTLTDKNFRYSGPNWWDPSYPGFTHMNYTSKNDFRFVNYYETNYLDYNITNWNVPGDGGVSIQVLPDDTYYTGNFSTPGQAHDNDWFTQATPAPNGILYYNYTIPVGAKTTSKFRTYQGEWIWDVTLPEGAYGGSELLFKSECDYDTPYVATYAWNYSSASWYLIQNDTARYFYESQMSWEYDASATIYVIPEHFDDETQTNVKGIDGDYDTKFWMYYGNPNAVNNETALSYSGVYSGAFTLGTEETYIVSPPVISNVVNYNGTSTSMNVTWDTDEIANGRIRYATNQWVLGSTWAYYNINKTDVFSHLKGDESHVVKLYTYSPYYVQTVDVTCSFAPYSNNPLYYWVNHSTGNYPAVININATAQTDFLNWTITYTYNKTIEWNTYTSDFMMANLPTDTKYYYQILAIGEGGNTTYDGTFTLGTPPPTPQGNIYSYDEDRPNVTITVWGNLTDMNGNPSVICSIQYWNETSNDFSETTTTVKNTVGTFSKTITVDYGHTYNYRIKMVGSTTGYSDVYTNDYMQIQEFFAGSYIEDDDNNGQNPDYRDREYRPAYPNGTVDLTARGYVQYGYWEGSNQEENWMWVETNITDKGTLTLHLYTKELGYMGDYVMNVDTDSSMRYIKLTNLQNYWYTFYITGSGSQMVLNWTKPSLIHHEHESRRDESKYVSFNTVPSAINYTLLYLDIQYINQSAYRWSIASGLDLYSAMVVEYWGGGRESGLSAVNTGTEYDRGQLFRGGVWNGEPYDTGTLEPIKNNKPMGADRYCFAFTDYWWNLSLLPSNNITNYYYRYWTMNQHWSDYLGYYQDRLFDYVYLQQFKYDEVSYTRDWKPIDNTTIYTEKRVDNTSSYTFNSTSDQSLLVGYKNGFSFDPSNDQIWNFGFYTDGRWTNQQIGKYQQAFIIFNLPDNTTLQGMDSDGDNLTDYEELFVYYTNPKSNDTDEDGFNDGVEINLSRDPNLYTSTPTTIPIVITNDATNVGTITATMNGDLYLNGGETCTVRFEYGTNTSYGTPTVNQTKLEGNFYADINSGAYDEYYYHSDAYWDYEEITGSTIRRAMKFKTGQNQFYNITSVKLNGIRVSNPIPNLNIKIKEVGQDGNPTGPDLAWGSIDPDTWGDIDWAWHTIPMTHFYNYFDPEKTYVFIIDCPCNVDERIRLSKMSGNIPAMYANGTAGKSNNSGSTWIWYDNQSWNFEVDYTLIGDFNPGTLYHYRAVANNSVGIGYGSDKAFLTKPNIPTGLIINNTGFRQQTVTWTHGTGYNQSVLRGNIGSYPVTPQSGISIYNYTGNSVVINNLSAGDWYYRIWEYASESGLYQFSDGYSSNHSISPELPTVTTNSTTDITMTSATLNGNLMDTGLGNGSIDGIAWDNGAVYSGGYYSFRGLDTFAYVADDFKFDVDTCIGTFQWWGYQNEPHGQPNKNPMPFYIYFFDDDGSGTMPTGTGYWDPGSTAIKVYYYPSVTGIDLGGNYFEYEVNFTTPFIAKADTTYWVSVQGVMTNYPMWNWANGLDYHLTTSVSAFRGAGHPNWEHYTGYDTAFYLRSAVDISCKVWFEWGATESYGNTTSNQTAIVGDFSHGLTNLSIGETYHYRAVADNGYYTAYGYDKNFTTEYPPNQPPNQPTNEYPTNNSVYIIPETYMNVTVSDPDADNMTVIFKWQNGTTIATLTDIANNSVASIYLPDYQLIAHDTDYYWYVVVSDGIENTTGPIWEFHTSKAWDLNGDKTVNYLDVSTMVSHYGELGLPGWTPADINDDGNVNYLDVSSLVSHYGESY